MTRYMPKLLSDGVEIPAIAPAEFMAKLIEIAGRPLTDDECRRVDHLAAHNWTLRTIASELFGDDAADAYFDPRS